MELPLKLKTLGAIPLPNIIDVYYLLFLPAMMFFILFGMSVLSITP